MYAMTIVDTPPAGDEKLAAADLQCIFPRNVQHGCHLT